MEGSTMTQKRSKREAGLRMNKLTAATGVAKSTILFYVSAGLLPEPVKTSPNMAYYNPSSVERIRLIQQMQAQHRLTLSEIKRCLDDTDQGAELGAYLELSEEVFSPADPAQLLDANAFCRETGLSANQLEELQQARLLLPLAEGRFDAQDVRMGRMYLRALNFGLRASDLSYYAEVGEKIVDQEMALSSRMTGRPPHKQDAGAAADMVKNARMCRAYVIDRLFQQRVAAMKEFEEQPAPKREEREPWLD
jgi:DNA-binding transcriptional MerR regulator